MLICRQHSSRWVRTQVPSFWRLSEVLELCGEEAWPWKTCSAEALVKLGGWTPVESLPVSVLKLDHTLMLCRWLDRGTDRGENVWKMLESVTKYGLYPQMQVGVTCIPHSSFPKHPTINRPVWVLYQLGIYLLWLEQNFCVSKYSSPSVRTVQLSYGSTFWFFWIWKAKRGYFLVVLDCLGRPSVKSSVKQQGNEM